MYSLSFTSKNDDNNDYKIFVESLNKNQAIELFTRIYLLFVFF